MADSPRSCVERAHGKNLPTLLASSHGCRKGRRPIEDQLTTATSASSRRGARESCSNIGEELPTLRVMIDSSREGGLRRIEATILVERAPEAIVSARRRALKRCQARARLERLFEASLPWVW